ncbi:hypothetical protein [Accumulibacter sp.]|uniref:hypothetical protein n=1 Tax=Accumulibacter sp. TaxID=2053492 RepID=UPI0025E63960|nr:hypothetical protein [Accumulibacter sp.]MCM8625463.1 hypothetical protein [Accumulibacter sp.]
MNAGSDFRFTGGRLDVESFSGTLEEAGGTLSPGDTAVGTTTIDGDYRLANPGRLEITLAGIVLAGSHDRLVVNGQVDLAAGGQSGGELDVDLDFSPAIDDRFLIIDNDGSDAVTGTFSAFVEVSSFEETFGDNTYRFSISYAAGDGNDVELVVTQVTALAAPRVLDIGDRMPAGVEISELTDSVGECARQPLPLATCETVYAEPAGNGISGRDDTAATVPAQSVREASSAPSATVSEREIVSVDGLLALIWSNDPSGSDPMSLTTMQGEAGGCVEPLLSEGRSHGFPGIPPTAGVPRETDDSAASTPTGDTGPGQPLGPAAKSLAELCTVDLFVF